MTMIREDYFSIIVANTEKKLNKEIRSFKAIFQVFLSKLAKTISIFYLSEEYLHKCFNAYTYYRILKRCILIYIAPEKRTIVYIVGT